jgi:hypothetical protein
MSFLRIMRPKLPSADRLTPYLKSIDASRTYSNFGPLALSLEDRLSEHYGLIQGTVTTAANATLGLAIALAAQRPPPGSLCAIPAWTFVASAHAALMAGLVPYFVDVEPETWAIDANKLADDLARAPAPIGAVMPVAPGPCQVGGVPIANRTCSRDRCSRGFRLPYSGGGAVSGKSSCHKSSRHRRRRVRRQHGPVLGARSADACKLWVSRQPASGGNSF